MANDPLAELRNGAASRALARESMAEGEDARTEEEKAAQASADFRRRLVAAKTDEEVADILEEARAV